PSTSPLPDAASDTVEPVGTVPGCQVTVAVPSSDETAPATPACAAAEPGVAAGTGAAATTPVTTGAAAVEPPLPVAVTPSEAVAEPPKACAVTASTSACPTSSATGRYVSAVAPTIGAHVPPAASQRCHW